MEVHATPSNMPQVAERTPASTEAKHPAIYMPRVVIIGAGFGGLQAAKTLAHQPIKVTLIDRNNHHLFQPMLYQVATAGLAPADIAMPIREILSGQENAEVLMATVRGVDVQEANYVASVIEDKLQGKEPGEPFHYFNKGTMATVGRGFGIVDIGIIRFTGLMSWLAWLFVHILLLPGIQNRLVVFLRYMWSYITYQRTARVILSEHTTHPPV